MRNRLSVAINWLWIYARDQRGARLITWWGGEVEGTAPFAQAEQKTGQRGSRPTRGFAQDAIARHVAFRRASPVNATQPTNPHNRRLTAVGK